MGKTFKEQRAKRERDQSKAFVKATNGHWRDQSLKSQKLYDENMHEETRKIQHEGPSDGKRFGNQRKMRAAMDVKERRMERHRLPDPIQDIQGDVELSSKADNRPKRQWSR